MEEIKKGSIETNETNENVTPVSEMTKEAFKAHFDELVALKCEAEEKAAKLEKQVEELKEGKQFWINRSNEFEDKYDTLKKDAAAIAQVLNSLTK